MVGLTAKHVIIKNVSVRLLFYKAQSNIQFNMNNEKMDEEHTILSYKDLICKYKYP